jgi:YHS domain-containing protein
MRPFVLTVLAILLSAGVSAARNGSQEAAVDALDGLDPVLLVNGKEVPGKSAFSVTRGGFIYLFSSADTRKTFESDPARYEIQLGGICAKMGKSTGANPADFIVHDGKIYIFGSDDCHKKFKEAPEKYLASPPPLLPTAPAAAVRGRQLIDRAVAAIGGAARLDALTTYIESFTQVQPRPQGEATIAIKTMWSFPDRVRLERSMTLAGKTMSSATVLSPEGMWFVGGQGQAYPMRPAGRPSLEQDFGRHPVAVLRARRSPGFKAVALGATRDDGIEVENVRVVHGATDVTLAITSDGRIHSITSRDRNLEGEVGTLRVAYSSIRPVEGLQLPFAARATFNGQPYPVQSATIESIALNTPLDPSLFAPGTTGGR